ncbi:Uncharacterized protein DAT39_015159, partial [Clarias magur]
MHLILSINSRLTVEATRASTLGPILNAYRKIWKQGELALKSEKENKHGRRADEGKLEAAAISGLTGERTADQKGNALS